MLTACLAFYSPSGYRLPQEYLAATLRWLTDAKVPVILAQVIAPGQKPQPTPPGVCSLVYKSSDCMFFKENLWNLAAEYSQADKLFFVDSDIRFSRDDVATLSENALDVYDLVQPFETALWFDRNYDLFLGRKSAGYALTIGQEPAPGVYHPGFAWAMTRTAFKKLGGFYIGHPFGGGDVAFAYSLDEKWLANKRTQYLPDDTVCWHSSAFRDYQKRGVNAKLRVSYLKDINAYHRWHGDTENRQYTTRCNYLPITKGEEYPLRYRFDGLLEWRTQAASDAAKRYFDSRKEDG